MVSPLPCESVNRSVCFECGLAALVLLATLAISLCRLCLERDRVCSQAGQVSSRRCCRALLTLLLYFPKLIRHKIEKWKPVPLNDEHKTCISLELDKLCT